MKTEKPKSLEAFLEIFNTYSSSGYDYYRGQSDAKWDIIPSIARNKKIFDYTLEVEQKLISKFEEKVKQYELNNLIPILKNSYHESWQILMAAQHYGLPTRFLDFTFNKYVALEFAITDLQHLDKDSSLIIYKNADKNHVTDEGFLKEPFSALDKSFFFQVLINKESEGNDFKLSEIRKSIQGSKFFYRGTKNLFYCLSLDREHSCNLIKIDIAKKLKPIITDYFIKEKTMFFDSFREKNAIDYFAAILKNEFYKLNVSKIDEYLKSGNRL